MSTFQATFQTAQSQPDSTCPRTTKPSFEKIIKCRSPNLRHVSRTHRVHLQWLFERNKLDSSISLRYVCTAEQVADMKTKCAFATIQWRSLMRLFGIHPPSNLNVHRSHSESSCSAVSPRKLFRDVERPQLSARSRDTPHTEYAPLGKTQRKNTLVRQAPFGKTQCSLPHVIPQKNPKCNLQKQGGAESDAYWR